MNEIIKKVNNETLAITTLGILTAIAMIIGNTDMALLLGGALAGGVTIGKSK